MAILYIPLSTSHMILAFLTHSCPSNPLQTISFLRTWTVSDSVSFTSDMVPNRESNCFLMIWLMNSCSNPRIFLVQCFKDYDSTHSYNVHTMSDAALSASHSFIKPSPHPVNQLLSTVNWETEAQSGKSIWQGCAASYLSWLLLLKMN